MNKLSSKKNIVDLLIDDFHKRALPKLMPRTQSMAWLEGKANGVVGMRRAGKTWFCYQKMHDLLAEGIPKERLLYLRGGGIGHLLFLSP